MKLGGWQRIGILLSMLWLIGVLCYAGIEYFQMKSYQKQYLMSPIPKEGFTPLPPEKFFSRLSGKEFFVEAGIIKDKPTRDIMVNKWTLISSVILPIVLLWGVPIIINSLFRWVRNGFKQPPAM